MNKILILGAGLVANPIVRYLLDKGYRVTVASNTPDRASEMIADHPHGRVVEWLADDENGLDSLIQIHDLTVSLLPYVFHVMVARRCVAHRKNMVTTSYVKPEMKDLDLAAREAGIIILNEIGLDPGIDHMSAMRIIDHIHAKGGAVLEFYSICGALPAPESADNPFRYKFSWSPKGVVMAGNNDARFLRHGKTVTIPTINLFKNPFRIDFPEIGTLEVYPNRDSLAYRELYGIPETQTLYRGTFRYRNWCEISDVMKKLNLISNEKFDMSGMTYADLMAHAVSSKSCIQGGPGASVRDRVAECLGVPMDHIGLIALEWLGMFEESPMNRKTDSTFEVVSDRMIERMTMKPGERDMVVLQHTFLAGYSDGRKEVIRSRMLDFGIPGGDTSVARTVALPAAIGVEMILNGQISLTGVRIPVVPGIYQPILNQLEVLGIKMQEEYNLPLSENID
ncbi:MAG: saccharopine dehydrogenase NADP-binding domain-containing protein [Bacteroidales bacterium]|nr:saccharopine dehydrogenase NADP-binding domain-containing protein [Bacteroidales bacterium]